MSELKITGVRVIDLRFPTSREAIGSDAVNKDPDYSAAYCVLETNSEEKPINRLVSSQRTNKTSSSAKTTPCRRNCPELHCKNHRNPFNPACPTLRPEAIGGNCLFIFARFATFPGKVNSA